MKKLSTTALFLAIMATTITSQAADPSSKPVAGPSTKLPSTELTTGRTGKHLFILSGQSNMARLKAHRRFKPHVEKAFGKESVIVVRDAQSGTAIRGWYSLGEAADGSKPESKNKGKFYDRLMEKVKAAIKDPRTYQYLVGSLVIIEAAVKQGRRLDAWPIW